MLTAQPLLGSPMRTKPLALLTATESVVLPQFRTPVPLLDTTAPCTLECSMSREPLTTTIAPLITALFTQVRPEVAVIGPCVPVIVVVQAIVKVTGVDVLGLYVLSPLYTAVMECDPPPNVVVIDLAPPLRRRRPDQVAVVVEAHRAVGVREPDFGVTVAVTTVLWLSPGDGGVSVTVVVVSMVIDAVTQMTVAEAHSP